MADPIPFVKHHGEAAVRLHFKHQATACDALGSPFTARLCRILGKVLNRDTQVGNSVLDWAGDPREDVLALRFCGALHGLVLSGSDERLGAVYPPNTADDAALRRVLFDAIARHDQVLGPALRSAPQTNEIARSAMLLPGFLLVARETELPVTLNEIGSSAGLNLLFDRFHYLYGDEEWGDAASTVRLRPEVRGAAVPLDGRIDILSRRGSDIAPVDVANAADRLRLRSYVWADQPLRLERLDAAVGIAAAAPFRLENADAVSFVRTRLKARRPGSTFVLFHSVMWQYMPETARAAVTANLQEAGAATTRDAPLAWLRMEPLSTSNMHATLSLTMWPGGMTRHLARCDYHGRWIEWLG